MDVVGCPYAVKMRTFMVIFASMALVSNGQPLAPATYIFGDSLADVGNNNHLQMSLAKAVFPPNGVDFPTRKPTGRFSNGKNSADFIAEKLGLPSPPPYLSMVEGNTTNFQAGVNFASGGACIFNDTDQVIEQSVHISKQIDYFSKVHDQLKQQLQESDLSKLRSKAIHVIIIGSNDILGYQTPSSNLSKRVSPTEFVSSMVATIKPMLQRIYDLGGRKFMILGLVEVGCCPRQRIQSTKGECNEAANAMAADYNKGLQSVLGQLSAQLRDFRYTYFDTYNMVENFTRNPQLFGFKEVKSACCGLGNLNADVPCIPFSNCCPNRNEYLFWDWYHPTEAADRLVVDAAFDGRLPYTHPIGLKQLVSM